MGSCIQKGGEWMFNTIGCLLLFEVLFEVLLAILVRIAAVGSYFCEAEQSLLAWVSWSFACFLCHGMEVCVNTDL